MDLRRVALCLVVSVAFIWGCAVASFAPVATSGGAGDEGTMRATFVGEQVLRFTDLNDAARARLEAAVHRLGLDVWAEHPEWVDVRVPARLLPHVTSLALPHRVMIDDLEELVQLERAHIRAATNDSFFNAFRTLDEFNNFMDSLSKQYPDLVTKITIGKTVEGRSINGIMITSNKRTAGKVGIVYNGGQHAREWISPMTNAYIAYQLVTLYDQDELITSFVDNFEWTIIPVVNCDGYEYTWAKDRMWRKNRRVNKESWWGCIGVDNNRNWGYKFNQGGSSTDPCSDTYLGPSGFSEPEETALANYIKSRGNVLGYIDFHSYSQMWMTPWGYTTALPGDYADLLQATKDCVSALKSVYGTNYVYGNIASTIYPASGSSVDWTYAVANVTYSFAVELRDTGRYGFVLPPSEIVPTGRETFAAVRAMASYIAKKL